MKNWNNTDYQYINELGNIINLSVFEDGHVSLYPNRWNDAEGNAIDDCVADGFCDSINEALNYAWEACSFDAEFMAKAAYEVLKRKGFEIKEKADILNRLAGNMEAAGF